jgi:hypothetical protein
MRPFLNDCLRRLPRFPIIRLFMLAWLLGSILLRAALPSSSAEAASGGDSTAAPLPARSQHATFDPARVAYLEKAGWEAYYGRKWPRVFQLMVDLNRAQFHMSLPMALLAAIDVVRASMAFAPARNNDVPAATVHLQHFYEKAKRVNEYSCDAATLAAREMDYWVVHRRLAQERQQAANHEGDLAPLVDSLANLHRCLFDNGPEAIQKSAEMRAQAAATVDRITGGYSTDVADDWRKVEEYLREAYQSLT